MSDWGAPDVQVWKRKARAQQQKMFLRLGDREWDEWHKTNVTLLHRKVGFGLFFLPQNVPDENNPTGYNEEQFEKIIKVSDVIWRNAKSGRFIRFACIFAFAKRWKDRFVVPVFKVKGDQDQTLFVDSDCRVYNDWRDYLDTNLLPKCMYCYPRDGLYQGEEGQVLVDFGTSPPCDLVRRIWPFSDATTAVVNLAPTTVLLASLLTVPIADQSAGQDDSVARMARLGNVGCAISIAQSRIDSNIIQEAAPGGIENKALRLTFNVLTVGRLTVNGLGTLNGFISLVDKADRGTLTPLDVFHWSTAVLFFSNNLLDPSTARGIIENIQQEVMNRQFVDLTAPQMVELFRLSDQVQGRTYLHRNVKEVKMINNIRGKEAFYESLVTARRNF